MISNNKEHKSVIFVFVMLLIGGCAIDLVDIGYDFEGIVRNNNTGEPIDSVLVEIQLMEHSVVSIYTDTTGLFKTMILGTAWNEAIIRFTKSAFMPKETTIARPTDSYVIDSINVYLEPGPLPE
jgi:hypothetical protein